MVNTGNTPILAADFERPLMVIFPGCEILSVNQTSAQPDGPAPAVALVDTESFKLEPTRLNPDDIVEYQCILDGELSSADVAVNGRIAGVGDPELVSEFFPQYRRTRLWLAAGLVVFGLLLVVYSGAAFFTADDRSDIGFVVFELYGVWGLMGCWFGVQYWREAQRARKFRDPAS